MSDTKHATILRQMAGRKNDDVAEVPQTVSRALRQTLMKSVQDTIGLSLTVMGVSDEQHALDAYLAAFDPDLMIIEVHRKGELAGIMALDMQLRAAILEMQTTGQLIAAPATQRKPTRTDTAMCHLPLSAFLDALPEATTGTSFAQWLADLSLGAQIIDARAAGLVLADGNYRAVQLGVDLGVADRQGQLVMALPAMDAPVVQPTAQIEMPDWAPAFRAAIDEAKGQLDAVLYRFRLPLGQARALKVGDVLPLHGCTVSSVRLKSPDGQVVAQAKLGQLGGMRAVRIEDAPAVQMGDLSAHAAPDVAAGDLAVEQAASLAASAALPTDELPALEVEGAPPNPEAMSFEPAASGIDPITAGAAETVSLEPGTVDLEAVSGEAL